MKLNIKRKKQRRIISEKINDTEHMDYLTRYTGKKVFSKSGEYVGKVKDVFFDKGSLKGFLLSGNLFLDKQYFTQDFEQAMMLQIEPVTNIIGKQVFDSDGKKIGKVKDLERTNSQNDYKALLVSRNFFSKPVVIKKKDVDITKKNVLLKVPFETKN